MSGSGKGVLGVVGISWNGSRAGTFPDKRLRAQLHPQCALLMRNTFVLPSYLLATEAKSFREFSRIFNSA